MGNSSGIVRVLQVIASIWMLLVVAATAGLFGNTALTDIFAGNFFLPLILFFVARTIHRQTRATRSSDSNDRDESDDDLGGSQDPPAPVERTSSATFKRRTPPPARAEPESVSIEDALKAMGATESSEPERIRPIETGPEPSEGSRPKTSAEMVEEAKRRFASDS